jgi:hypothetical protein
MRKDLSQPKKGNTYKILQGASIALLFLFKTGRKRLNRAIKRRFKFESHNDSTCFLAAAEVLIVRSKSIMLILWGIPYCDGPIFYLFSLKFRLFTEATEFRRNNFLVLIN